MRIGLDQEFKDIILHTAKQTLAMVALAMEKGEELTPEIIRNAQLTIIKENGKDTLGVCFSDSNADWNNFDHKR